MTAPQLPGPSGNVPPHVPATFRPVGPGRPAGSGGWGRELAALTGPASAPPGGLTAPAVTGPRGARRKASPPSRRAAAPASPAVPALVAPPPATAPVPAPAPEPDVRAEPAPEPALEHGAAPDTPRAAPVPPLPAGDRERLLSGTHPDPHAHLGPRTMSGGTVRFRTLRPYATSVAVLVPDAGEERRTELLDEGDGFFAGEVTVPCPGEIPGHELLVRYGGGAGRDGGVRVADPYGLPPALGELDLRLFGEGRHETLWRALGARTMTHHGVSGTRFTVWAPNARGVRVAGDFNRWDGTAFPMRRLASSGVWELFLPGVGDGALYKFEVVRADGSRVLHADPMARTAEVPSANASAVHTSAYRWGDGDWLDRRAAGTPLAAPMSVYEVHLPSWRPGLTYRELAAELPSYVRESGFTHVELMPCAEHPSRGSWGYPATGFYAPSARLGDPDGFRLLVDSLHRAGIGVLMDWSPAHFPEHEWALARFDGPSLYERPAPERAGDQGRGTTPEFDLARPEVRNFLVACAVHWCEEFHLDGLRVGAVGSMLRPGRSHGERGRTASDSPHGHGNPDAVALLQQMNATLHRRCPGVVTAAEESTDWDGVTRATDHKGESGFGGLGFDLKWNTAWTHDSLSYMRQEPAERARRGAQLTRAMTRAYSENFILPVPHDEVAHGGGRRSFLGRTPGDAWRRRADHRAFLAFMWAHPGKQLLFMGQEFAQEAQWSEERGPDWRLLEAATPGSAGHRGVRDLVRDLNSRYASTPALWQLDTDPAGFRWVEDGGSRPAGAGGECVFALLRFDASGDPLLSVSNFSPVAVSPYRLGVPHGGGAGWREVLNTDEARYGGSGAGNPGTMRTVERPAHGYPLSVTPVLPALTTLWLRPA